MSQPTAPATPKPIVPALDGWKTKSAAALSILYGIGGFALKTHDIDSAFQFVVQGLGILGIGHKIQKAGN